MQSVRKQIISILSNYCAVDGLIKELKECLDCENNQEADKFIELWLNGCISSLYYNPNKLLLLLTSKEQGIGKTEFFRRLLPVELMANYAETKDPKPLIYEKFIVCNDELHDFTSTKKTLFDLQGSFKVSEASNTIGVTTDKRLSSFCGSTNFYSANYNPAIMQCRLKSIDKERYNAIDKRALWGEIFNKFKQ